MRTQSCHLGAALFLLLSGANAAADAAGAAVAGLPWAIALGGGFAPAGNIGGAC